ncbi:flagellar basal body P-ring formation chaperone FlgA [Rhodopirellula sp. P2]|nr:flagellar basal body P-ring formation chaperone FlgA [Rhodopirellula sp. P2]WDQ16811.1 flagellar basal body P-ring formation chaperone FlgA [Rhodopirellula sp. P2]
MRRWFLACAAACSIGFSLHLPAQTPGDANAIANAAMRTPFHGVDPKFNRNPAPRILPASMQSSGQPEQHAGRQPTQPRSSQPHSQTIDANTRWQFTAIENASTGSPIIRLRDVVRPLHANMAAWPRLADATVGLMPLDGTPAKISRDRLADLIVGGQATAGRIKIYGNQTIVVHAVQNSPPTEAGNTHSLAAQPVSAFRESIDNTYVAHAMLDAPAASESVSSPTSAPGDELDFETRERLSHWVQLGLKNQFRDLPDAFDYEASFITQEVGPLTEMQGIREIRFLDPIPTWSAESSSPITCRLKIDARSRVDDCEGIIRVTFTPKPAVVVARRPLQRGHRVGPGDVHLQPSPVTDLSGDQVMDVNEVIGMEVVGLIRADVPLRPSDFAAPRLVRRGDLVEVQVTGGGIRVTTTAKALGDGAQNELIEIETLSPKRRLLAKVVEPSVVEIVTQPNRVLANQPSRKWQPQP